MRWFLIILGLCVAAAAVTSPWWWNPVLPYLGDTLPVQVATLAGVIGAIAGVLSVIVAVVTPYLSGSEQTPPAKTSVQGTVIKGSVNVRGGDFVGRDKLSINNSSVAARGKE